MVKASARRQRRKPRRETLEILGANIRMHRARLGYSQERLADEAGINRSYVGDVERCQQNPTTGILEAFADALGVSIAELWSVRPRR
jgi:transcriptional regulator with XRE-family HTH domain